MSTETLVFSALIVLLSLITSLTGYPARGQRSATKLSSTVGLLPPKEPLLSAIARRGRRRGRWVGTGIAIGAISSTGLDLAGIATGAWPDLGSFIAWVGLAGILLGGATGTLLSVITDHPTADPTTHRVAHPRASQLDDYLDPVELIGTRVTVGLGLVLTAGTALWQPTDTALAPFTAVAVLTAIASVIALLLAEYGGRRVILQRPRVAGSPIELAWDDALRAADLRGLYSAPFTLALYSAMCGIVVNGTGVLGRFTDPTVSLVIVNVGFYVGVGTLVLALVVWMRRLPGRYYLTRLWPEVAAQGKTKNPATTDAA